MYDGSVQTPSQKVFAYIRRERLLKAGDRVGAAVSGGLDSVALLRLLLELRRELGIVLSVVHFNHQLRGAEAEADEGFVRELAREHKLAMHCEKGDVAAFAAAKKMSLEAAARELRYKYFCQLLQGRVLDRVATAHTLDDQAETVLMRLVRGAGTRGLAGIYPWLSIAGALENNAAQAEQPSIVRPLLAIERRELKDYLAGLGQTWREDKSNRDLRHARNRVRHGILPRLERNLNPAVRGVLAETAEIARGEEDYWKTEVARLLPTLIKEKTPGGVTLRLHELAKLPLALQRRVVREAAELIGLHLEFRHVEDVLGLGLGEKLPGSLQLPNAWTASRKKDELRFACSAETLNQDYDYWLKVPGRVEVAETGTVFEACVVSEGEAEGYNAGHFFDPVLLSKELHVRNWRAGDHFRMPHTKGAKKIKELLQQRRLAGEERKLWPVVLSGDEIVWVRGFPGHARFCAAKPGRQVILIRELPLNQVQ